MVYLKNCKKTGEQKSFFNRERFFYAHFITSFKKFTQVRKNGQSTLEYFIIITLVIVIGAFGVSQFFNKSKSSAKDIFDKAVTRINKYSAAKTGYLMSCRSGGASEMCSNNLPQDSGFDCAPGLPCNFEIPGGPGAIGGGGGGTICWQPGPDLPLSGAPEPDDNFSLPESMYDTLMTSTKQEITLTSADWQAISGLMLSPGRYYYSFAFDDGICYCPTGSGYPSCDGSYLFVRLNIEG